MSLEELKKAIKSLMESEKKAEEIKEEKPKPSRVKRGKKVKAEREVKSRPTEVYRAIYFMLTGTTIRGSKEKAIKETIKILQQHLSVSI